MNKHDESCIFNFQALFKTFTVKFKKKSNISNFQKYLKKDLLKIF